MNNLLSVKANLHVKRVWRTAGTKSKQSDFRVAFLFKPTALKTNIHAAFETYKKARFRGLFVY